MGKEEGGGGVGWGIDINLFISFTDFITVVLNKTIFVKTSA